MNVERIISGGQTGADQGGLMAGLYLGIPTGGWCPLGWRTEDGPSLWLADFGLREWVTADYIARTRANVAEADATIIFGRRSVGSNRTEEIARQLGKPCRWFNKVEADGKLINGLLWWLDENKVRVLNVAGNRESVSAGIRDAVCGFLMEVLDGG